MYTFADGRRLEIGVGLIPRHHCDVFSTIVRKLDSDDVFDQLWVPDERFFRDCFVAMTTAALNSERLRIGSAVTDAFVRHPALTATAFASIDEVSNGRAVLGIGAGAAGLSAMGIGRDRPQTAIREAVELMRLIWSGGHVDYQGQTTSFNGALDFEPIRPAIPIWIAGRGPKILELAGGVADGVLVGGLVSTAGITYAERCVEAGAGKAGRDPAEVDRGLWLHLAISSDADAAKDAIRAIVATVIHLSPSILDTVGVEMEEGLRRRVESVNYTMDNPEFFGVGKQFSDRVLGAFSLAGSPDEVLAGLDALSRSGIQHIGILPWLTPDQTIGDFVELLSATLGSGSHS